jgi:hypothetical protein
MAIKWRNSVKLGKGKAQSIDRPEVCEVFCDSLGLTVFDGVTLRAEFLVTRLNPPNPPEPPSGRRYTAARLVMTPSLVADLYTQLGSMLVAMEKKGLIKREGNKTVSTH